MESCCLKSNNFFISSFQVNAWKIEEERAQEIRKAFIEYAKQNWLSAFNTPHYFAK
jgi:hypothetical protein